jgi:anti-anti-sigma factor
MTEHARPLPTPTVALEGEWDLSRRAELAAVLRRAERQVAPGQSLTVDLQRVEFIDSAVIALLYRLRARLHAAGSRVEVVCRSGSIAFRALEIAGLLETLSVRQDSGYLTPVRPIGGR